MKSTFLTLFLVTFTTVVCTPSQSTNAKRFKLTRKGFYPYWLSSSTNQPLSDEGATEKVAINASKLYVRPHHHKYPSKFSERISLNAPYSKENKETSQNAESIDRSSSVLPNETSSDLGWLNQPKKSSPEITKTIQQKNKVKKVGFCGPVESFGIRCGQSMDQCQEDRQCPGKTKCCQVSDCGLLCVTPQEEQSKDLMQITDSNKASETTAFSESVTTAEGLKIEDIQEMKNIEQDLNEDLARESDNHLKLSKIAITSDETNEKLNQNFSKNSLKKSINSLEKSSTSEPSIKRHRITSQSLVKMTEKTPEK